MPEKFPEAFPKPPVANVAAMNVAYGGWNMNVERDPWRGGPVSAEGLNPPGTPVANIDFSDGFHSSDLITANALVDTTVLGVEKAGLALINAWVEEWKLAHEVRARTRVGVVVSKDA
ncbi:hypothetical protein OF83DRAFT_1088793 [Amylostereum chailletii]|nr:hypothetical protein OF83DRAFT_1088793 [Amylostereum chailletii]